MSAGRAGWLGTRSCWLRVLLGAFFDERPPFVIAGYPFWPGAPRRVARPSSFRPFIRAVPVVPFFALAIVLVDRHSAKIRRPTQPAMIVTDPVWPHERPMFSDEVSEGLIGCLHIFWSLFLGLGLEIFPMQIPTAWIVRILARTSRPAPPKCIAEMQSLQFALVSQLGEFLFDSLGHQGRACRCSDWRGGRFLNHYFLSGHRWPQCDDPDSRFHK